MNERRPLTARLFNNPTARRVILGGAMIPAAFNQLGGLPFSLTPDTTVPNSNIIYRGSGSGVGLSIPAPPSFPGISTGQTIANTVTGQLKFDQITALISQGLSAFGKNPSQQISGLTVRTVQPAGANYSGYGNAGNADQINAAALAAQQAAYQNGGAGSKGVGALSSALDGFASSFGLSTSVFVLLAAGGIYLLMREPPKRR